MATPVIIARFGMTWEEASIVRWHKQEAQWVDRGDDLLEVMTDYE